MEAVKGLFDSKRAFFTFANYIVICVLMFMGKMSVAEWMIATGANTGMYLVAETVKPSKPAPGVEITRTETAEGGSDVLK